MNYQCPESLEQALALLQKAAPQGRVIAGGTDLVLDLQSGKFRAETLIDVSGIDELRRIERSGGYLRIGCAVTHTDAARSEFVRCGAPALTSACRSVGSLQVRNVATLVGNVVSAQPAADAAVALAALGTKCRIVGPSGERTVEMQEMYAGFGKSTVDPTCEIVAELLVPEQQPHEYSAFVRLNLREALALPMLNLAAMAHVENGIVAWMRMTMAPVGVGPVRAAQAESWLTGKTLTAENICTAAELTLKDANPRSNILRGSREYRMQTLPVLAARALTQIAEELQP